jgi:DNA-directed RNA polymerase specialized sigma24 family protein
LKSDGEIMEILNAYDLTGSYRAAADLCGCSHHTVRKPSMTAMPVCRRRLGGPG